MADEVSKVLGQTDIMDRLEVTNDWMGILRPQFGNGGNMVTIRAFYWYGSVWEFGCDIRPGRGARLRASEWQKFIRYAGIQRNDRLILQAKENLQRGTNYNIRAERRAADGWYNVPPPARDAPAFCQFNI